MIRKIKLALLVYRGKLIKMFFGRHLFALIVSSRHGLFAVDPMDFVGWKLLKYGRYGESEISRLKIYLTEESNVLVVGAHIGSLVIPISRLCKKVIAIEANPESYHLLNINLKLNDISNCQAINVAAGDKNESIDFLISRVNSGGCKRVPKKHMYIYYYDNPETICVNSVSLDSYLQEKSFDLIVMDIEGSEYFALKGMQGILSKSKVLQIEFLPHHLKNISGVTVEEFLGVIEKHFSNMVVPSKKLRVNKGSFRTVLNEMYHKNQEDEGIIFEKA